MRFSLVFLFVVPGRILMIFEPLRLACAIFFHASLKFFLLLTLYYQNSGWLRLMKIKLTSFFIQPLQQFPQIFFFLHIIKKYQISSLAVLQNLR
jgi:hypothetical protein